MYTQLGWITQMTLLFSFVCQVAANRFWCLPISFSECLRTDLFCHYLRRNSEIKEKIIFTIYIFPDINIKVTGSKNSVDRGRRRRSHYFTLATHQSLTHSTLTSQVWFWLEKWSFAFCLCKHKFQAHSFIFSVWFSSPELVIIVSVVFLWNFKFSTKMTGTKKLTGQQAGIMIFSGRLWIQSKCVFSLTRFVVYSLILSELARVGRSRSWGYFWIFVNLTKQHTSTTNHQTATTVYTLLKQLWINKFQDFPPTE